MAQLSDDCFAFGGELMAVDRALALLAERVQPVAGTERVTLAEALGRILAEDVVAPFDVPPHDNAAVDGYAVFFDDLAAGRETVLPVTARLAAGQTLGRPGRRGEAVRIFTGAPMPGGFDTVLMQEDCRAEGGTVIIPPGIKRGANWRKAGEDIARGKLILSSGRRLRPEDIGLLASVGRSTVEVRRLLRAAVFSTGNEVREPGAVPDGPLPEGCIYDANRFALMAALRQLGCAVTDLGILPDRFETIRDALAEAAATHDVLVSSGGMSTGEEDHVRAAVEAGGALHFWRLAIKPGRPVALGHVGKAVFIGLPGNPVAVMVTFQRLARPILLRLMGAGEGQPALFPVSAGFAYKKKAGRREYVRAILSRGEDGTLTALKHPREGAGILSSMVESDGLVELPEELTRVEPGMVVSFLPFSEVR